MLVEQVTVEDVTLKIGDTICHQILSSKTWTQPKTVKEINKLLYGYKVYYKEGGHDDFSTILHSYRAGTTRINCKNRLTIAYSGPYCVKVGDRIIYADNRSEREVTKIEYEDDFGTHIYCVDTQQSLGDLIYDVQYNKCMIVPCRKDMATEEKVESKFPMLLQDVTTGKYFVVTSAAGLLRGSTVRIIETSIQIL